MQVAERLTVGALVAASGGAVMLAILARDDGPLFGREALFLVCLAAAGAFLAGLCLARLFGRPGRMGIAAALGGAVLSTAAGAAIGAVLAFGPDGVPVVMIAGPVFVGSEIVQSPFVAATWGLAMATVHAAARRLRRLP